MASLTEIDAALKSGQTQRARQGLLDALQSGGTNADDIARHLNTHAKAWQSPEEGLLSWLEKLCRAVITRASLGQNVAALSQSIAQHFYLLKQPKKAIPLLQLGLHQTEGIDAKSWLMRYRLGQRLGDIKAAQNDETGAEDAFLQALEACLNRADAALDTAQILLRLARLETFSDDKDRVDRLYIEAHRLAEPVTDDLPDRLRVMHASLGYMSKQSHRATIEGLLCAERELAEREGLLVWLAQFDLLLAKVYTRAKTPEKTKALKARSLPHLKGLKTENPALFARWEAT